MVDIKNEIVNEHRCFRVSLPNPYSFLEGAESSIERCAFFVQMDGDNFVFCEMKPPTEITFTDFFKFSPQYLNNLIAGNRIELL